MTQQIMDSKIINLEDYRTPKSKVFTAFFFAASNNYSSVNSVSFLFNWFLNFQPELVKISVSCVKQWPTAQCRKPVKSKLLRK